MKNNKTDDFDYLYFAPAEQKQSKFTNIKYITDNYFWNFVWAKTLGN